VARDKLFVTTKVGNDESMSDVEGALRSSLKKLQLDYVDLYVPLPPL
jgi:diketogulonate reductase-like aldo/keto reductase